MMTPTELPKGRSLRAWVINDYYLSYNSGLECQGNGHGSAPLRARPSRRNSKTSYWDFTEKILMTVKCCTSHWLPLYNRYVPNVALYQAKLRPDLFNERQESIGGGEPA